MVFRQLLMVSGLSPVGLGQASKQKYLQDMREIKICMHGKQ